MRKHFILQSTICFVVPALQSRLNHSTLHWTVYVCPKPFVPWLNHSILHWTICVCLKPFVSRFNHSTLHWTICVWLKPLTVCVNSFFTQTITQQSSRPLVIKLDHFVHGILMAHNLNKPILVWRYRFHSIVHFILPLTRNTTTVYRNTLKIIYNIPTKLFTRSNVVKARKPM